MDLCTNLASKAMKGRIYINDKNDSYDSQRVK